MAATHIRAFVDRIIRPVLGLATLGECNLEALDRNSFETMFIRFPAFLAAFGYPLDSLALQFSEGGMAQTRSRFIVKAFSPHAIFERLASAAQVELPETFPQQCEKHAADLKFDLALASEFVSGSVSSDRYWQAHVPSEADLAWPFMLLKPTSNAPEDIHERLISLVHFVSGLWPATSRPHYLPSSGNALVAVYTEVKHVMMAAGAGSVCGIANREKDRFYTPVEHTPEWLEAMCAQLQHTFQQYLDSTVGGQHVQVVTVDPKYAPFTARQQLGDAYDSRRFVGTVRTYKTSYGFIECHELPSNLFSVGVETVFVHKEEIDGDPVPQDPVEFSLKAGLAGKPPIACQVKILKREGRVYKPRVY